MATLDLEEARRAREDRLLDEAIDKSLGMLFSEADTVGPHQRHQLRGLLRYYAKQAHPFRQCVRDNMKRFGPGRTESVCATLKDIIRGTTHWRGHPELDHGSPGAVAASAPELGDELVAVLLAIPDEKINGLEMAVTEAMS
jgi:hypothetical protein